MAHPSLETHFGSFCQVMWKNTLWVHFRCILLHSRTFTVILNWGILKKNGNWKKKFTNSCTVHRVSTILKLILNCFLIETFNFKIDQFCCWSFTLETRVQFPLWTQFLYLLFALILLIKSWKINLSTSIFCQGAMNVMLLSTHRYDHIT